ncbi:MAG: hypothetical protein AAFR00_02365 [Pseudomonadota bacterium]
MIWTIAFWTVLVAAGFALFLAYQMRYFAGFALRNVIASRDHGLARRDTTEAVTHAVAGAVPDTADQPVKAAAEHLIATYSTQIGYIRLSRTLCRVLPYLMAAVLLARWALNGGI